MTHKIMTSFVSHQAADQLYDLMNKCTVVSVHRQVLTEISTLKEYRMSAREQRTALQKATNQYVRKKPVSLRE